METNRSDSGALTKAAEALVAETDDIGLDGPEYEAWIRARRVVAQDRRVMDGFVFFHDLDGSEVSRKPERRSRLKGVEVRAWISIDVAADLLGLSPDALRKAIDRRAKRVSDGGIEAHLDGLRARKFGRRWKVQRGGAWFDGGPR